MNDVPDPDGAERLVDLIGAAVLACPAVAGLHGGQFGQVTTYLPGRRVAGVTVSATEIVVGVVGRYPAGVDEIANQVRDAVGVVAPGVPVTVNVEDLLLPGGSPWGFPPGVDAGPDPREPPDHAPGSSSAGG